MMAADDLRRLAKSDFPSYVERMNRQLRLLDRMLEARETNEFDAQLRAWAAGNDYFAAFRERVAAGAIKALAALGVEHPEQMWRMGVIATRVWLLEIASPPVTSLLETRRAMESNPYIAPESPAGEWWLWVHAFYLGLGVFEARLNRRFGKPEFTIADLEEARLTAKIPNEQWLAMRKRAAWVLAP